MCYASACRESNRRLLMFIRRARGFVHRGQFRSGRDAFTLHHGVNRIGIEVSEVFYASARPSNLDFVHFGNLIQARNEGADYWKTNTRNPSVSVMATLQQLF